MGLNHPERQRKLTITDKLRLGKNASLVVENANSTESTISLTELASLDGLTSSVAELNILDGVTATASEINQLDGNLIAELATGAGTGITAGTGTVYETSVQKAGGIYKTSILIDLTGLNSAATLGDIIGVASTANPCHFGRITAAECGSVIAGIITCLETPAGGEVDIDIYSATESTGVTDGAVASLTETALMLAGVDWTISTQIGFTAFPAAGEYLYLTTGTSSTPTAGTYTAGKFLIEMWGV
jgi:hypothetical protein